MSTTYTITSQTNTYQPGPPDPQITITGIINGGVFVGQYANWQWSVNTWTSTYNQVFAQGNAAVIAFYGPLIVANALSTIPAAATVLTPVNGVTGTFSFTQ
jgi:hypothetical protein